MITQVCDATLSDYLSAQNLYTKDFPTDAERFDAILDKFKQNEAPWFLVSILCCTTAKSCVQLPIKIGYNSYFKSSLIAVVF
jgi:hypothetical protein